MLQWRISRHWHSPIKLGRYSSKYQYRNLSVSSHWSNCMWIHFIFFALLDFIFRKCQSRRTLQWRLSTRVTSHYLQSMEKFAARNTWCQYSDSCHNSQNKDATDWWGLFIKLQRLDVILQFRKKRSQCDIDNYRLNCTDYSTLQLHTSIIFYDLIHSRHDCSLFYNPMFSITRGMAHKVTLWRRASLAQWLLLWRQFIRKIDWLAQKMIHGLFDLWRLSFGVRS